MTDDISLDSLYEVRVADELRQLRAAPVRLGDGREDALLCVHSAHPGVDPGQNHFTLPTDTLKLTLVTADEDVRWTHDVGEGIVPGVWFCPVFPFDLDGDGVDEIWYVDTEDPSHPFSLTGHRLGRIDATTGERTGMWEWPDYPYEPMSMAYRNFIFGGHADGEPVLVTAQGTYREMRLQGWNPDLSPRWETTFARDDPGSRGSHLCPVLDVNDDGVDEVLWGERLLELDGGEELWCADRDSWSGHSDIVQPTLDHERDTWYIYTCRESHTEEPPRVVTYDAAGERVWSALDEGHMHTGWTARLGDRGRVAMAGANKHAAYDEMREYAWDVFTGDERTLDYPVYSTLPVDLDGDGVHELVYEMFDREGRVVDHRGDVLGDVDDRVARFPPSKLFDLPGEQFLTYTEDGRIRLWGDSNATDGDVAHQRYAHPYYRKAQRLAAVGYNWRNVAGL
ncbi:hypothetical protein SAMN04487950_3436 [Halogranum rubrum]|uniref:Rhamnogalacturonan lyase family 11 C-terminal domain-containing protein n=1 Tax=Halogranum rubrum TaxID=553466 RepID=A0A1I4GV63_9EURY|nr:hypothetical protein [Halogranum rubrum]SFL33865.1 hypothetical protein SAMN04487950_3436 [Halogranum rubrum]